MGYTTCKSERQDKKQWHGVFRTREKAILKSTSHDDLDAHLSLHPNQVSNAWSMGKDGRQYFPIKNQADMAGIIAERKGTTPQEKKALKKRLLRRWMGK